MLLVCLLLGACAWGPAGRRHPRGRRTWWASAATTLALVPSQGGAPNPLTPALRDALAGLGFAAADAGIQAVAVAEALRYEVGPLGGGLLVRFELGGAVAGRWYARSRRGALSAGSPFTVREAPAG